MIQLVFQPIDSFYISSSKPICRTSITKNHFFNRKIQHDSISETFCSNESQTIEGSSVVPQFNGSDLNKEFSEKLKNKITSLEKELTKERKLLHNLKEKKSECGKNGYFMIQARVNDFKVKCIFSFLRK